MRKSHRYRKALINIVTTFLILLFVYTSLNKIIDYSNFKNQLNLSPYLTGHGGLLAILVPLFELIIAICMLFQRTRLLALYGAYMAMVVFSAYVYAILNWSYYIPCNCGGIISLLSWKAHLIFNISIAVAVLLVILFEELEKRRSREQIIQTI